MEQTLAKFKQLLSTKLDGFTMSHAFDVARDKTKEAKAQAKAIFVTYDCTGLDVGAIFDIALRPLDIKVQNEIRKDFDAYSNNQKLEIVIADMGKHGTGIAPEKAVRNKFAAASTVGEKAATLHESTGMKLVDCIKMVQAQFPELD